MVPPVNENTFRNLDRKYATVALDATFTVIESVILVDGLARAE
jgi:hypothetical protein